MKGTYFSSGGYPAEYGNALSGMLVMESKDLPSRSQYTFGTGLAALSAGASVVVVPEKIGASLSGNYSDTGPMFKLNRHRRTFSNYPRAFDLNVNAFYRYLPGGSVKLFLFREEDEVGIEVKNPVYGGFFQGDSKNSLINLQMKQLITSRLFFTGNWAFSRFRRKANLNALDLDSQENLYQFRFVGEYRQSSTLKFRGGVEWFDNRTDMQGKVPREYLDLNPEAPTDKIDLKYRSQRNTAFFQTEWRLLPRLNFFPGVRLEYESVSGDVVFDPRLSISLNLLSGLDFTLASGVYHQFPEPYYYDPFSGNPSLKSAKSGHHIAGISYRGKNTMCRMEVYYKNYKNLLLEAQEENFTNNGYGYARGMDIFLKHSRKMIKGWLSYSYLNSRRYWMDAPGLTSPEFDITHNLSTVIEISLDFHWNLGFAYRYATGKPYSTSPHYYLNARVPPYKKLDVNLTYLYRFFENNLTVFYIAVSNVLGRDNIFDYYYSPDYQKREPIKSTMRRTVYFGVTFSF
ncbi:MAG: hypothetical protein Kow0042_13490 [Calditrichia bacterium]